MITINSVDEIFELIKKIKNQDKGYLTNFFPDIPKNTLLISQNLLEYIFLGKTVFIRRKNSGFYNLYFIINDLGQLEKDLKQFISVYGADTHIIDIIGMGGPIQNLRDKLKKIGLNEYTSLVRMSRISSDFDFSEPCDSDLCIADQDDGAVVLKQLNNFFDKFAEQLPLQEEIANWVNSKMIIVSKTKKNDIQGFMIFDRNAQTSFLKYWFVHPDYRDRKIGSALLRRFFFISNDTKRQLFWVIRSNHNAIKRYRHFGFMEENLYDYVLTNKNLIYEG